MKNKIPGGILAATLISVSLASCGDSLKVVEPKTEETMVAETTMVSEETETAHDTLAEEDEYIVNEAASKDPKVVLVMAEVNPLNDTICGKMDRKFVEAVEEISGGSITIDLKGSGIFGSETEVVDAMLDGRGIDISRISTFVLTIYGAKKSVLLSLPYTFESREHYWKFVNSDIGTEILNESEESGIGVKGLFYGEEGFRHFFTVKDKPVLSVEDFKGLKIRVSNDPIMVKMVESLGATAATVSVTELHASLQKNTIDGAEQPIVNYASNRFDEVAPNLTLDSHTLGAIEVVISEDSWKNKLTDNQRAVIEEASKIASDYCHSIAAETENDTLEKLKARGCNVIDIGDMAPWQDACRAIAEDNSKGNLADVYAEIRALT